MTSEAYELPSTMQQLQFRRPGPSHAQRTSTRPFRQSNNANMPSVRAATFRASTQYPQVDIPESQAKSAPWSPAVSEASAGEDSLATISFHQSSTFHPPLARATSLKSHSSSSHEPHHDQKDEDSSGSRMLRLASFGRRKSSKAKSDKEHGIIRTLLKRVESRGKSDSEVGNEELSVAQAIAAEYRAGEKAASN
ncbi:hypothetical protein CYLTODRAFT_426282 [Cylindrobasidium torrendii FP15055 ss-10]|uniref:Uncharacterized protein n=1 Tax=Cylindrobasidium torrendii FP15055 ss-10 TaxID=1314674 RepID=A0A0D7B158_9AGAR|nr:hypothetical protein CYLTODRAFT_426282 [Cylindrobasidium torrendii FP15055 ss-10]